MLQTLNKPKLVVYIILCLAIILRCIHFGSIPAGYLIDEAGMAMDAYFIAHFGTDRYGISYPIYFINYGDGQSILYTYCCAAIVYCFGFTEATVRLPALIFSALFAFFGIKLIGLIWKDRFNVKTVYAQILFVTLYAISPYCFIASRFGLDCNLMLSVSTIFLYFFTLAIINRSKFIFFVSGIFCGLVLYTYAISYIIMPIFLIMALAYLIRLKKINLHEAIYFTIPLTIIAAPLITMQYINIFDKSSIMIGAITITKLPEYRISELTLSNVPQNIYLVFKSTLAFDWIDYNTVKKFCNFYHLSIIFAIIGLIACARQSAIDIYKKIPSGVVIIFLWFIAELILGAMLGHAGQIGANPNANKMNGIFFAIMFFIIYGMASTVKLISNIKVKKFFAGALIIYYFTSAILFLNFYFHEFQPKFSFGVRHEDIVEFVKSHEDLSQRPPPSQLNRQTILDFFEPITKKY